MLVGCSTTKQQEIESVARDWSRTIRASQIIPVYPLTEDLQPGDIFLVQVPVDRQQEIYDDKGYLPLDNHIARLHPKGYLPFYDHSFVTGEPGLPRDWIRPKDTNYWGLAPHAAFPTYSFSVKRGGGMNVALPVSGVPVGLSLLGSSSAEGTIAIRKAASLGIDTLSLYRESQEWALANADFLASFAPSLDGSRRNYLRVVTRVYATGEMDVSLADADASAAGVDAGVPKPVNLLYADLPAGTNVGVGRASLANYTNHLATLNGMLETAKAAKDAAGNVLPGGSLRITSASSRAITLKETFTYPLVIGYLAFDCLIQRGGTLGPPIPTHSLLDKSFNLTTRFTSSPAQRIYAQVIDRAIYNLLVLEPETNTEAKLIQRRLDALEQFVPPQTVRYTWDPDQKLLLERESPGQGQQRDYNTYIRYVAEQKSNLVDLNDALAQPTFWFQALDESRVRVDNDHPQRDRLERFRNMLATARPGESEAETVRQANSAAINYFIRRLTQ